MADWEDRLLVEYLPRALKEVREYRALMFGEQPEIFNLFAEIENALRNQFVSTSLAWGVARWEKILGIVPSAALGLDERKFTVLARLNERLPYTWRALGRMLGELCGEDGFTLELDAGAYVLRVRVALAKASNFNDVAGLLRRVCPANLILDVSVEYNQWFKLEPFRWGDLGGMTWDFIRNEVF